MPNGEAFTAEKNRLGDKVLANGSVPTARQYAKTGCPINIRPHVMEKTSNIMLCRLLSVTCVDLATSVILKHNSSR